MPFHRSPLVALALAGIPFALASQQTPQTEPTCEQVFKNIKSFKGVPAKDLIPAMEFMSASLKVKCTFCHEKDDYAAETQGKETGRDMITLQRDINSKYFNNRLSVTCMSCHYGREHPLTMPLPEGTSMRHARMTNAPKPEELFKKHIAAVGPEPISVIRVGTVTTPSEEGESKSTVVAGELVQASGGRFVMTSGKEKFGSDGKSVWRGGFTLGDEPAAIFGRMGRAWRGQNAFDGLERVSVSGKETVGKATAIVVRGSRTSTGATEELYFDEKSGLLTRFVNSTRSSLGSVVTVYDYANYKAVKGVKVPMKVTVTFAGDEQWIMAFKTASVGDKVDEKLFLPTP